MNYTVTAGSSIEVNGLDDFIVEHILECGQVFRSRKVQNCHTLVAGNCFCILQSNIDNVIIKTSDTEFFTKYFDLDRDYGKIKSELQMYDKLPDAIKFGHGIRILNQDIFETIISFIISANNNIPRIQKTIERMCSDLGNKLEEGIYSFPTAEAIVDAGEEYLKGIGTGYRAPYILDTCKKILNGYDLESLKTMNSKDATDKLLSLSGVGPKVANCIQLFSLHQTDMFPVDTWVKKIYLDLGFEPENSPKKINERLVNRFGNLSGYAQQYLFYYYRSKQN